MATSTTGFDVLKWAVAALGAVVSFYVVDLGKLRLERFRVEAENQRLLLASYLTATESIQPDVWKRKLHVLQNFAADKSMRQWAVDELQFIENFAEQDALYRETLKIASLLIDPARIKESDRQSARSRYEQLYWADLPFARESGKVASAMINFRDLLRLAEKNQQDGEWEKLNIALIGLSKALRDSRPEYPKHEPPPARQPK